MGLTESLVRTKSSILTCKLAESFDFSSFLGRAILNTQDTRVLGLIWQMVEEDCLLMEVVVGN